MSAPWSERSTVPISKRSQSASKDLFPTGRRLRARRQEHSIF